MKVVGHCSVCEVPMFSTKSWPRMTDDEKRGSSVHRGHGLCTTHYRRLRAHGDPEVVVLRTRDSVLEDWVLLRDTCTIRQAAERMGMTYKALDQVLRRASQRGDERAYGGAHSMENRMRY